MTVPVALKVVLAVTPILSLVATPAITLTVVVQTVVLKIVLPVTIHRWV